jgi:hypothetical protein
MRCTVCGGSHFTATEYNTGDGARRVAAPALECTKCKAIVLEEHVARTKEERESVKMAIAMRSAIQEAQAATTGEASDRDAGAATPADAERERE